MSISDGQHAVPLRPIPIHLHRSPRLDAFSFRLPVSVDKLAKPMPPLWNPAFDLYLQCNDSNTSSETQKTGLTSSESLAFNLHFSPASTSSILSSATTPSLPASTVLKSLKRSSHSPDPPRKVPPTANMSIYKQLDRRFPTSLSNPITLLASKEGLIPFILGVPKSSQTLPSNLTSAVQSYTSVMSPECHMNLNDLALVQTKTVMGQVESSHPETHRVLVGQRQPPHPQHHHNEHHPQQHTRNPELRHIPQLQPLLPPSERASFQNTLTQTRAFIGRGSAHVISPVASQDNMAVHGYGRKFFLCTQCRYTTDRRNNLKRHMLTMHQTSSKMLECCGIFFNTKASLREHAMLFHYHGYTCYFCGRRFCRKALLKRHLSVHNGQKDYACDICDYATSHKSNLERHRKIHSRQEDGRDGEEGHHYHDDRKWSGSEAVGHDDISGDEVSVCSDSDDDIEEEINVHSD